MKFTTIPFTEPLEESHVENLKEWIKALRSGEYKQVGRCLVTLDRSHYCCLGVACEIQNVPHSPEGFMFGERPLDLLPDTDWFIMKYGFDPKHKVAYYHDDDNRKEKFHLAHLNDGGGLRFEQIADVIQSVFIDKEPIEIVV